ncbi:MAG: OmpA family protein [Treponema sp.]|jgi:outer membrane protein OmpA-like peptidoglycan-associated protein|nr:OmpA family protein [Treponema sp.]
MIKRRLPVIMLFLAVFSQVSVGAHEFVYKFKAGDKYRVIATVNEDVYVNRRLSYHAEILDRISMEVTADYGDRAAISATFQTAERTVATGDGGTAASPLFIWDRDYQSEFVQDRLGYLTIADRYYMPMVRNVPAFPDRNIEVGESWSAQGIEVHDFRDNFGIEEPYRIPFTANYTYLGERVWRETSYPAFSVSYRVLLEPQAVPGRVFPRRILEACDQIVYWDAVRGQAVAYEEYFRIVIDLSDGQTYEYRGVSEAEVVEAPPMAKEDMVRDITEDILNLDIPDVSVRITDEGIVISLENIQFDPDSAVLRPSEKSKLDKIAEILLRYPDRDILVGGHTAMAGTAAGRMQLSVERAASVAEYLLGKKVRTPDRVVIRGYGAEQPIADNRTAEGMERNRRVEITILEN